MRKLLLALTAVIGLLFAGTAAVHADSAIKLYLDGRLLKPDVPPQIMNNTTLVPVRLVSEELGAKVSWSEPDKKITVEKNGLAIVMHINKAEATVNGAVERLEKSPILWQDTTTLVPVRFISEKLGLKVSWDELTQSVGLINASVPVTGGVVKPTPVPAVSTPKPGTIIGDPGPLPAASSAPKPSSSAEPSAAPAAAGTADPAGSGTPVITSISLDGDVLRIQTTGGALAPKLSSLAGPDRIILDLPNAVPGKTVNGKPFTQNGEMSVTHPVVTKIRYALYQDNPSIVRIVVDLKQKIEYNLLESKIPGELALGLGASAAAAPGSEQSGKKRIVVLDAGHGGKDSGALSAKGRKEKDFNLAVVLQIYDLLKKDSSIDVRLTRSDDTFLELDERVAYANDQKADVFVSIHANKVESDSVKGVETYYTRPESAALAAQLHKSILEATGSTDRRVRTEGFRVTKYTVMPAVLCEIGYLSNVSEEEKLFSTEQQAKVAASIAAAIQGYLQNP
ncbi:N-acetylmuramoyl-L-alanine amidase [Gorillibacterium sp. sgz5001074]|uniref:N-acetylmuramoyl-L-alanine amidase n=1 Tax=Gorillibacterium sp. sgz5001074 TaxID=3446695 RepID=UPI003F676A5E